MARVSLVLATFLIQLVVGEDLHWVPNSNWDNPSNWKYERPPCSGEVADFASVPENSLIYLNTDATVRSIVLPTNGKIVLGSSVTIQFSEEVSCQVDRNLEPDVSEVRVNTFTGATPHYWECPNNWLTEDNFPATNAPCGTDRAIFDEGSAYSFVSSNQSVRVHSLSVRGVPIESLEALSDPSEEFRLNLTTGLETECSTPPTGCVQDNPPTVNPPTNPSTNPPTNPPTNPRTSPSVEGRSSGGSSKDDSTGIVAGVVVTLVVVILVVVLVVVGIILYMKRKRTGSYTKDDLLEPGNEDIVYKSTASQPSAEGTQAFDNPMYESATMTSDDLNLIGHEISGEPEKSADGPRAEDTAGYGFKHALNEYESL